MALFVTLNYFSYFVIFAELLFSLYRKDRIHSISGTVNNVVNGIIVKYIAIQSIAFYSVYLFFWDRNAISLQSQEPLTLFSFITCLLLVDFCYYIFHSLHHSFAFLWMFHSVHHGDDKLNLSTAFRISWIEQLYIFLFFAPILLIGFSLKEVLISYFFLVAYQFFCHNQYLQLPKTFDLIFVTPHSHRIHHDQTLTNQNSNFGGVFSIWDRLFGTYTADIEGFTPGIAGYRQDKFLKLLIDPIMRYF